MVYEGKDRIAGYALIGASSGIAVAVGPLIGGYFTTYLSWRYVFAIETIVMTVIILSSFLIPRIKTSDFRPGVDVSSMLLSAFGMALVVFGILQSKVWGWIVPKATPQLDNFPVAPFGVSIVAYLIAAGLGILYLFYRRQQKLEAGGKNPLLNVSVFRVSALRSGLAVLSSQYLVTGALFFILPIYLQLVLGLDALATGFKVFPLSVTIVLFAALGSKLVKKYTPHGIVWAGQIALVVGSVFLLISIYPQMRDAGFAVALLVLGSGLGLLVSQIGNITMSSVQRGSSSSEVGGLQGTFQNLGSSLGVALIGSVMISSLAVEFTQNLVANPDLPQDLTEKITAHGPPGLPVITVPQVQQYALEAGLSQSEAEALAQTYSQAQMESLRLSVVFLILMSLITVPLSRNIPKKNILS